MPTIGDEKVGSIVPSDVRNLRLIQLSTDEISAMDEYRWSAGCQVPTETVCRPLLAAEHLEVRQMEDATDVRTNIAELNQILEEWQKIDQLLVVLVLEPALDRDPVF